MNNKHQQLFTKIKTFAFDKPGTKFTFAQRLARENGWSIEYTNRVIEEYRKFIFLAVVAEHLVTPSEQVDRVWHLHLTYTRSYWNEFCPNVLGQPLHHQMLQYIPHSFCFSSPNHSAWIIFLTKLGNTKAALCIP